MILNNITSVICSFTAHNHWHLRAAEKDGNNRAIIGSILISMLSSLFVVLINVSFIQIFYFFVSYLIPVPYQNAKSSCGPEWNE